MTRSRLIGLGIVGAVLLILAVPVAVYGYVASGAADARIAAQLQAAVGAPVEIGGAQIGASGLALRKVQVLGESAQGKTSWLTVGNLATDLGWWDLLRGGGDARRITLTDAALTLDFDVAGHLLTPLPSPRSADRPLPEVTVANATVTLRQEGRPPLVVTGVNGTAASTAAGMEFTGTAADPTWGEWAVRLSREQASNQTAIHLKTAKAHCTRAMLEGLPFVPPSVWQQVRAEGDTAAEITVQIGREVAYRVVLNTQPAQIGVVALDLQIGDVTGEAVIEGEQVHIRHAQGRTADGAVRLDADLDFQGKTDELHFTVAVEGVEVRKLPAKWKVPELIEGKLNGQADLQVAVGPDGKRKTTGSGEGLIPEGHIRVGTQRLPSAIRLRLRSSDQGYEFTTPPSAE